MDYWWDSSKEYHRLYDLVVNELNQKIDGLK